MKLNRMLPVLFGIGILGVGAPKLSVKSDDLKNRIFQITRTTNPIIIDVILMIQVFFFLSLKFQIARLTSHSIK